MAIRATKDLAVFDGGGGNGTPKKKPEMPKAELTAPPAAHVPATQQPKAPKTKPPAEQTVSTPKQPTQEIRPQPREKTAEELAAQGRYDETLKALQGAQGKLDAAAQPRKATAEELAAQGRYDEALAVLQGAQDRLGAASQPRGETEQEQAARAEYERAMATLRGMDGSAPTYNGGLDKEIGDLYAKITGRGDFQYDLNEDAMWQQLKDDYTRLGKQAMQDTMGRAAALTGGYGSSYGQMAGQSAYDQYLTQLSERAPELYDRAYQRYRDEGDEMRKNLSFLMDRDATAYGRFQDEYNRYLTERDYNTDRADAAYDRMARERAYGDERYDAAYDRALRELGLAQEREGEAYSRAQRERAYGDERYDAAYDRALRELGLAQEREGEAYSRAQRERAYGDERADLDYERAQQERAYGDTRQGDQRKLLLSLMEIGYTPMEQEIAEAGLSQSQADALAQYYKSLLQPASTGGGGGGYGSGAETTRLGKSDETAKTETPAISTKDMKRQISQQSKHPGSGIPPQQLMAITGALDKARSAEEIQSLWRGISDETWSKMSQEQLKMVAKAIAK